MEYRAYGDLTGTPHVVVDGSAQDGTVLCLSHWPGAATPELLRRDLSTEIAFAYNDHPEFHTDARLVTNNHFDHDGLGGIFALVDPEAAEVRRDRLIDVARAGDFSCFAERESARVALTIAALGAQMDDDPYPEMIGRLPEIVDHVDRFERLWADEDAHIRATQDAIASGAIRIDEHPDLDLAVVHVPPGWAERTVHRFMGTDRAASHPWAVHNATTATAVVTVGDGPPELRYRYETWVHMVSRRPRPRSDLTGLASDLSAHDTATWTYDDIEGLSPALHVTAGETSLADDRFVEHVLAALRAPARTWSPYPD